MSVTYVEGAVPAAHRWLLVQASGEERPASGRVVCSATTREEIVAQMGGVSGVTIWYAAVPRDHVENPGWWPGAGHAPRIGSCSGSRVDPRPEEWVRVDPL